MDNSEDTTKTISKDTGISIGLLVTIVGLLAASIFAAGAKFSELSTVKIQVQGLEGEVIDIGRDVQNNKTSIIILQEKIK